MGASGDDEWPRHVPTTTIVYYVIWERFRFGEMCIPAVVDWFQTEESMRLLNMANEGLV